MAKVNKTKYALLGILSIKPASGYDIKRTVDGSIGFFWNENFGHIYPMLKRLEKEGLVKRRTRESEGRPVKNIYSLTAAGEKDLLRWLSKPSEENSIRNEMLLKLFFGRQIERQKIVEMISTERKKNVESLKKYSDIARIISQKKSPDALYWKFTLNFGMRRSEMIVSWCDETLKAIDRMK